MEYTYQQKILKIGPLDNTAMDAARQRQSELIKPPGSLGRLELLAIQIAGITGTCFNAIDRKVHLLFGADNGVCAQGVAGSPQQFTAQLMECYGSGRHCAINLLCAQHGVDLRVIDVGVIGPLSAPAIIDRKLMQGTDDFSKGPAMPREIVHQAIETGFLEASRAVEEGYQIVGTGEVGIGNTTTSAACIMAVLGIHDPDLAVGRGAGLDDQQLAHKKAVITKALQQQQPNRNDPVAILSAVGGLDIAALTGVYLAAAYKRVPVVVDGVISVTAALLAAQFHPLVREFMIPSHLSQEPAYRLAADALALRPLFQLDMRLGEGTGCPIAMGMVGDALAIHNQMEEFAVLL